MARCPSIVATSADNGKASSHTEDGKFVAGFAELKYQAGAFPGSPVQPGVMCAYAPYDIENVKIIGYDVVSNRPRRAAPLVARAEEAPAT